MNHVIRNLEDAQRAIRYGSNMVLGVLAQQYEYGLVSEEVQQVLVEYMMQDTERCLAVLSLADTHNWPQRLAIAKKVATSPEHARRVWRFWRESLSTEVADIIRDAINRDEINKSNKATGYPNLERGGCW